MDISSNNIEHDKSNKKEEQNDGRKEDINKLGTEKQKKWSKIKSY